MTSPEMPFEADNVSGSTRENLEGWIPALASDGEIREALEKAFDYRGDVSVTLKDGSMIEGYIFDRSSDAASLNQCFVRLLPKDGGGSMAIAYDRIAALAFTGRDTAAGKSWETWVRKYEEKKAAGEKNIGLEPETLD